MNRHFGSGDIARFQARITGHKRRREAFGFLLTGARDAPASVAAAVLDANSDLFGLQHLHLGRRRLIRSLGDSTLESKVPRVSGPDTMKHVFGATSLS